MPANHKPASAIIALSVSDPSLKEQAADLAANLDLQLTTDTDNSYPLHLRLTDQRLEICQTAVDAPGPVFVDFTSPALDFRRRHGGGAKQQLARAIGIKGSRKPLVLDATAGLGRDSFILAALGCRVIMVERNPIIAALLEDGLRRARLDQQIGPWVEERMQLIADNFIDLANSATLPEPPETIYLDPMFPARTKKALVKKEMRFVQELVGKDEDAPQLLEAALKTAQSRVTVKRPKLAEPIEGPKPNFTISGRSSRFDVYLV